MATRSAIPAATYRLQLHLGFTLDDAAALVPYLQRLGVSHLYLSPILVARPGSMHGYDVIDQSRINPELGGEAALLRLAETCHASGLGVIVDIVPNHMAVGPENALWLDVLEHGAASAHAKSFDIDFSGAEPGVAAKLVLPVLGEPYGQALDEGKLALVNDAGRLTFTYGTHRFPLRAQDYAEVLGGGGIETVELAGWQDKQRLHELLERQNFRLCWWRAAGDTINWRRFFDVNELAGIRMEDDAVFEAAHAVIFRLYEAGVLDGVRVDHVDGLADPAGYARKLRARLTALNATRPASAPHDGPYIVVEKILGHGEQLADDWGIDGTSGYDFMDQVSALQHDGGGARVLDELWEEVSGRPAAFDAEETAARREILLGAFAGQLAACARAFMRLAECDIATRDLTQESFRRVLVALIAHLRIYRCYATGLPDAPPLDENFLAAWRAARAALPADAATFDFLIDALAGRGPGNVTDRQAAVRRLNHMTAPVAAKAVEDTAFYRYGRLLSRNDVGFDAACMALDTRAFLVSGAARARDWPRAMLATATHDHKRGEDVRARLAVLSELPEMWRGAVRHWLALTAPDRPANLVVASIYMLFQTLVGAWPFGLAADDAAGLAAFGARVAGWREKSLREAKLRSSWAAPDETYEMANLQWLGVLLDPAKSPAFLQSLGEFVARVAPAGAINGVVQAALRCAWPGVPDLYQGAELWDFSLVDPDNRRPVDYGLRLHLLEGAQSDWLSGAAKQSVIARLLAWRREDPVLFTAGTVEPIGVRGARAGHVLAFRRRAGDRVLDMAVMLRVATAVAALGDVPAAAWWEDTQVECNGAWRDAAPLFDGAPVFCERL